MTKTTNKLEFSEAIGSENQMDQRGSDNVPVNPLPVRCAHCGMPDIDFVPQPYYLAKGTQAPTDMAPAEMGNYLVRTRVREVYEKALSGMCTFFPTHDLKTKAQTDWWLAVPIKQVRTNRPKPSIELCPQCGEPKSAHGTQMDWIPDREVFDVSKSFDWNTHGDSGDFDLVMLQRLEKYDNPALVKPFRDRVEARKKLNPLGWQRSGVYRLLYFSIRLDTLHGKLGFKGLRVISDYADRKLTPEDLAWVQEKLALLGAEQPRGRASTPKQDSKWFDEYLKAHAAKKRPAYDWIALEQRHGVKLPDSYKAYVGTVRPAQFRDIDGNEGFDAKVLPPNDLDFRGYRKGETPYGQPHHEESKDIDGVSFADTGHFDCFVFDIAQHPADPPVYLHNHEENRYEAYAENFVACLKRFSGE